MKQYGKPGLCLLWGINNALNRVVLTPDELYSQIRRINKEDRRHNIRYFEGRDGIDFKTFRKVILEKGIYLRKMKNFTNKGRYLITYDFGDYLHTIALVDGVVLDSRKNHEITSLNNNHRLVDVYKIVS